MQKFQVRLSWAMHKLLNKYKNIDGSYSSTLIEGVAHYLCDSGIYTDAFSVADATLVHATHGDEPDDERVDVWHEAVSNMDLQCNDLLGELFVLAEQYNNGDTEDLASTLAEGEDAYNATRGLKRLLLFGS